MVTISTPVPVGTRTIGNVLNTADGGIEAEEAPASSVATRPSDHFGVVGVGVGGIHHIGADHHGRHRCPPLHVHLGPATGPEDEDEGEGEG